MRIDASPVAPAPPDSAPFLNRVRELAALESRLERAVAGYGALLLISGEGGIGKTRLVSELAARAERAGVGARFVWGRCWDSGGAPSMWPWTNVLRDLFAPLDAGALRSQLGAAAPWLAQLVPELGRELPELVSLPALDSEQSRFVLFDALSGFLGRLSAEQPLVIVLDDLHAADQLSLLALLFLARQLSEMRVLVIGTHREADGQAGARTAALFTKLVRSAERLPLSGLEAREIGRLIDHRGGAGSGAGAAETLQRATGGNPFFADEILRTLRDEGRLDSLGEGNVLPLRMPIGVRALIEQRLEALPEQTVRVLRHAAVIGERFSLATLAQVSPRPRRELLDALERVIEARLVEPRREEVAGYGFVHDLIRETVYAGMRPLDRARGHAAVGAALERRYAGAADRHLDELAHHFLEALPAGDALVALDYAERAADRSLATFAHERAAQLYAAALGALDLLDELGGEERSRRRARLLVGLGRAQLRIADPRGRETLLEAAAAARAASAADALAEVALAFGAFALSPGLVDRELTGLLEEALALLPEQDSGERARLLARLARALYWSAEAEQRRGLIDEAVAMARRLGDPDALAAVLGNCIPASRSRDTAELELGWIYELLSLNRGPGELFVLARSIEIDLLLERGAIAAADAAIDSLAAQAQRLRDIRARPYVHLHRARRATMEGRFDDAEQLIDEAVRIAGDLEDSTVPILVRGALFMLRLMQGRAAELTAEVRRVAAALPEMQVWSAGVALICARGGQREEAQRLLKRLTADGLREIPRNNVWTMTVALLSEVAATLGERACAEPLRRALLPFAELMAVSPVNGYVGPVARYLGLLALLAGDRDEAESHLRRALELVRRQPIPPMVALIALDLAQALLDSPEQTAQAEALALCDEGESLARMLDMTALVDRAGELRAAIERAPDRAPRAVVAAPAPGRGPLRATLVREGEVWRFDFAERPVHVRDSKGMQHLAQLLAQPGVEIHALLLGGAGGRGADAELVAAAAELPSVGAQGPAGPVLDDQAKAAYRRRLEDLRDELEEAERWADPERASRARGEIEFLGRELAAAVGIGGRDRPQAAHAERARVNVTRAIRTTIRRVAEQDAELGAELETTIRTGLFCRHEPDIRRPVHWEVHGG